MNSLPIKMIVSGNYSEYLSYCQENGYNPNKDKHIRYVRDAMSFRGFRGYEVVLYGNHHLNPVYNQPDYYDELLERASRTVAITDNYHRRRREILGDSE